MKVLDIFNTTSSVSNDKMLNITLILLSGYKNDSFNVDYGDSTFGTYNILSGFFFVLYNARFFSNINIFGF